MLHAGLDLSRRKVDVCLLSSAGEVVDEWASPPDADGLRGLAARAAMWGPAVRGVIESMNGARFVHDRLIDELDLRIAELTVQLKRQGADHRYIPVLVTAPGIGWINAYTIASEIGDIARFASPAKLCGYTGLCPRVKQSGGVDARGPLSKHGPQYLRWALFEAALNACKHPTTPSATSTPSAGWAASAAPRSPRSTSPVA
jgi:transposase